MRHLSLLVMFGLSAPLHAQSMIELSAIDAQIADFTGAALGRPGGAALPVDRRLRLRPCGGPLALDWHGLRRDAVVVACPQPGGWRIFVPIQRNPVGVPGAPMIARGDAVSIVVQGEDFAVSQPGEALEAGGAGDWIRVRMHGVKSEPIRARVIRPGAVGIDLP